MHALGQSAHRKSNRSKWRRISPAQFQRSSLQWDFTGTDGASTTVSINASTQINNSLAIRSAELAGRGIARMPTFIVGEDIKSGRLQVLLPEFQALQLSVYLIYPQRQFLSPKVRAFVDFLAQRIGDSPAWD